MAEQIRVDVSVTGGEQATRTLNSVGSAADEVGRKFDRSGREGALGLKALDEATRQLRGVVDDFASRIGPAGAVIGKFGQGGTLAAAGIGALTAAFGAFTKVAAGAELEMAKIGAVIKATGGASGVTTGQVDGLSKSLARASLVAESELKAAATQLLTFKNIAGETFGETLRTATDIAALGFTNVTTATQTLAKALEDPKAGMEALKRAGVDLTAAEAARIAQLQDMNQLQAAQNELLRAATEHVGGAASASSNTLIGGYHRAKEAAAGYVETVASSIARLQEFRDMVVWIADFFDRQAERWGPAGLLASKQATLAGLQPGSIMHGIVQEQVAELQKLVHAQELAEQAAARYAKRLQEETQRREANSRSIEAGTALILEELEAKKRAQTEIAKEEARASREKTARDQAVWEDQERRYVAAVKDMHEAALRALEPSPTIVEAMTLGLNGRDQQVLDDFKAQQDRLRAISDEAARDMYALHRDLWKDVLSGNLRDAEDYFKRLKQLGSDWAASHLAERSSIFANNALTAAFGADGAKKAKDIAATVLAVANLVGGIFGPRPSDRTEGINFDLSSGWRQERDLGPNKDSPENRAAANALFDAVNKFRETLVAFGLNPAGGAGTINVGNGNSRPVYEVAYGASGIRGFATAEEAFKFFADQIVATLSEVPERLQVLVDGFDGSNVEEFLNSLQRFQAFDQTLANVRDEILRITDPQAWEIKQVTDWFDAIKAEAEALGYAIDDLITLRDLQLRDIAVRYAPPGSPEAPIAAPLQQTANWLAIISGLYDDRIAQLEDEAAALRESAVAWERIGQVLRNTRAGLLIDPNLSPLSLEARRGEAFRQLEDAFSRAQAGDAESAGQLPELARAALTASREFYRSSEDYYRDFEAVQRMLGDAASYASQQVTIDQMQLSVQQQILETLRAQQGAAAGVGRPAYNAADVAAITESFQAAWQRSGLSRSDFLQTQEGQNVWLPLRAQWIAGITDQAQLTDSLRAAREQKNEGGYAGSDAVLFEQQVTNRLRELGLPVPSYDVGGMIGRTGLAYVHAGEHVTPAGAGSTLERRVDRLTETVENMARMMGVGLSRIADNTGATAASSERTAVSNESMALTAGPPRDRFDR